MQKLIRPSIAILLSSVILFGGVAPPSTPIVTKPLLTRVGYNQLKSDDKKQVDCLADNIYFEARQEPVEGQMAVAFVTLNRVQSGKFPETVCGVVKQRDRKVCQFSWWCSNPTKNQAVHRKFGDWDTYRQVRELATHVFVNYEKMPDVTNGALYYHAEYVPKRALGVRNIKQTVQIGQHIFYRNLI